MARFILLRPIVGAPPGGQYRKWATGQTIADTAGNALAGDVVWPSVCASAGGPNSGSALAPLDAAAAAQTGLPITTLSAIAARGTAGGAGLDAGN
jgi:hypothetical protein